MINYCQSAQCRTRFILEYFGEAVEPDWTCKNCDACDGALAVTRRPARGAVADAGQATSSEHPASSEQATSL